jgi:hypothetical protein
MNRRNQSGTYDDVSVGLASGEVASSMDGIDVGNADEDMGVRVDVLVPV